MKTLAAVHNWSMRDGVIFYGNVRLGRDVFIFPGAVIGRPPLSSGATTRRVEPDSLREVEIGDGCVIGSHAVIYAGVKIGRQTMICDSACIREGCVVGDSTVIGMGVTVNYDTRIGNRVKIMDNSHLTGNMLVEDDVFISVLVTTSNDNSMGVQRVDSPVWSGRGPTIRRFARIGQGACLLPGVEIGENAVVGANAVVTRDVPSSALAMGVPARVVRMLRPDELKPE